MTEQNPNQSFTISGGQLSGVQIGQAGRDLTQSQQNTQGEAQKQLNPTEVVELIIIIESLFKTADLPPEFEAKALKHLDYAKDAVQESEPDKDTTATSLKKAAKVLKEANEVCGAGLGVWHSLEPVAKQLAPWLGIAAKSLLLFP